MELLLLLFFVFALLLFLFRRDVVEFLLLYCCCWRRIPSYELSSVLTEWMWLFFLWSRLLWVPLAVGIVVVVVVVVDDGDDDESSVSLCFLDDGE